MLYLEACIFFLIFVLGSLLIGHRLLEAFNLRNSLTENEVLLFSFAIGMGLLSFLVFFLGLLGLLYLKWVLSVFIAAILVSLKSTSWLSRNILSLLRRLRSLFYSGSKLEVFLISLILLVLLLTTIGVLAPAKGNDALVYHLSDAKYFAQHHRVEFIPYTSRSIWPYFMQMLFTLALLFKSVLLAKFFHFSMALFCGLAVYSFGRRYINRDAAFLAMGVFFLTPGVFTQATYAYIDLSWAFYTFVGFYAFLLWDFSKEKRWLIASGIMCGVAADTKYIALVIPFIIGFMLIMLGLLRKESKGFLIRSIALFSIAAGIVIFPYYIRPYLYTGNPFYPFYCKFIGEGGWLGRYGFDFGMEKTIMNFIVSPWFVTYYPGTIFGGAESQLGPLYLAFLPVLLFIKKRYKPIFAIFIFALAFYTLWFFVFPAIRYILPLVPFLALLVGYVIWHISTMDKKLGNFANAAFATFLVINLGFCFYYNREEIAFFAKGAHIEDYLAEQDRAGRILQYINKNTAGASKVLLVNEARTFYLDREYIREDHYRWYDNYHLKKIDEIIKNLKAKGITHILYAEFLRSGTDKNSTEASDNRLQNLIRDRGFAAKYLDELIALEYNDDLSQRTWYRLYKLR